MEDGALESVADKPTVVVGNKTGFKNQSNIKAAARGIVLEALTAFKGGKVGKRGLLVRAMAHLDQALAEKEVEGQPTYNLAVRARKDWAVEQVLKLANGMTKDDKAGQTLTDLLQGGNVQISFNTYFDQRHNLPGQSLNGQALTRGFTPPPGSGDRPA